MRHAVIDEFTDLNVSHQRKTQLRHRRDGLCERCSRPALVKKNKQFACYCKRHAQLDSMKQAIRRKVTIRKTNCKWGKRGERFDKTRIL